MHAPDNYPEPQKNLTPGLRATLVVTSILWLALWITATIVADRAESMPRFRAEHPHCIIAAIALAAVAILVSAIGQIVAFWNISSRRAGRALMLFAALWVWITTAAIVVGHFAARRWPHLWPIPEIFIAAALTVLLIPIYFALTRRCHAAPIQAQTSV